LELEAADIELDKNVGLLEKFKSFSLACACIVKVWTFVVPLKSSEKLDEGAPAYASVVPK
jgi:hypothetical protein